MIFFSDFHWHDLGFLAKILICLDFLARLIIKIMARNLRNPRSLQELEKYPRYCQKIKNIQDYRKSWQENQDAKHQKSAAVLKVWVPKLQSGYRNCHSFTKKATNTKKELLMFDKTHEYMNLHEFCKTTQIDVPSSQNSM